MLNRYSNEFGIFFSYWKGCTQCSYGITFHKVWNFGGGGDYKGFGDVHNVRHYGFISLVINQRYDKNRYEFFVDKRRSENSLL